MPNLDALAAELDAMHAQAKSAFERRDLPAYREFFSPELAYSRADGHVISRDQLMRDVTSQFRRLGWVQSSLVRESLEGADDQASEVLTQSSSAGATAFFFLHRIWKLTRRGQYDWTKHSGRWQITRVKVLEESVTSRFHFGFHPPIET